MSMMHPDPEKHPHPRRYRRALAWCLIGCGAGILLTVYGLWVVQGRLDGLRAWLAASVLVGPSIVFLSCVGFATYLERLEQHRYGEVYEDSGTAGNPPAAPP